MKRTIVAICIVGALFAALGDAAAPRRGRPKGLSKPSGGIVEKAYRGKTIRVVNVTKAVEQDLLNSIALRIRRSAQLPIDVEAGAIPDGESAMAYARAAAKADGIGATVVVVDDKGLPIIMSSPDEKWAILNVASFKRDELEDRMLKSLWGAVARAVGAGSTGDAGCVLVPFGSVQQLDAIAAAEPSPVAHNALIDTAKMSGINMIFFATYRTACQQGWAPQPTNDVQRTIWNEIHAIPDRPITIEFDPKRDK